MKYLLQILIALDQLANAIFGGYADETISSRAYRMQTKSKKWALARKLIDGLFFWQKNHCRGAYYSERQRKHLPADLQ